MAEFGSDDELLRHVRGQVGVKKASDLPEEALQEELERGKREINREVRERLNNGESVDFYDQNGSDQRALQYYLLIRGRDHAKGEGNGPTTVASIRRNDFGDQTMNHWRDRLVTHLNNITE